MTLHQLTTELVMAWVLSEESQPCRETSGEMQLTFIKKKKEKKGVGGRFWKTEEEKRGHKQNSWLQGLPSGSSTPPLALCCFTRRELRESPSSVPMAGRTAGGATGLLRVGSGAGGGGGRRSWTCGGPRDGSPCALRLLVPVLDQGVQACGRGRNPSPAKIGCGFSLKVVDIKNSKEFASFPPSTSFFSFSR